MILIFAIFSFFSFCRARALPPPPLVAPLRDIGLQCNRIKIVFNFFLSIWQLYPFVWLKMYDILIFLSKNLNNLSVRKYGLLRHQLSENGLTLSLLGYLKTRICWPSNFLMPKAFKKAKFYQNLTSESGSKQRFSLLKAKAVIQAVCLRTQAVSIKARF